MAPTRNTLLLLSTVVFSFSLALRLIFLLHAGDAGWPHSTYFEGDAPLFAHWAAALDRGETFEQGLPLHSPAVAHFMKWLLPSGNSQGLPSPARSFQFLKLGWCAFSALTSGLLFWTVARRSGVRTGLVAGGLLGASFGSQLAATSLNGECLYALGIVVIVWMTQLWVERPSLLCSLGLGVLHGACILLRAEHPLLLALLAISMLVARRRTGATQILEPVKSPTIAHSINHMPQIAGAALVILVSLGVCMPWAMRSSSAILRLNTMELSPVNFDKSSISWSESARELLRSMPAFARSDNFEFISASLAARGETTVEAAGARQFLIDQFLYVPEPMSRFVLVSSQGPLAFALANHPRADGGFSKVALDARFGADPPLQLSLPSHLRLYNHGYAVGWQWIRENPAAWGRLILRKLDRFWGGVTLGLGGFNWPHGRDSVREATDLATPAARNALWNMAWILLLLVGSRLAWVRRQQRIWLIVIVYKLIVTVFFFGYARQAVSISPAFFVLAAIAIDAALRWAPSGVAWRRTGWGIASVLAITIIAVDWHAARMPAAFRVRGPAQLAPQWGAGAFECPQRVELILDCSPSP